MAIFAYITDGEHDGLAELDRHRAASVRRVPRSRGRIRASRDHRACEGNPDGASLRRRDGRVRDAPRAFAFDEPEARRHRICGGGRPRSAAEAAAGSLAAGSLSHRAGRRAALYLGHGGCKVDSPCPRARRAIFRLQHSVGVDANSGAAHVVARALAAVRPDRPLSPRQASSGAARGGRRADRSVFFVLWLASRWSRTIPSAWSSRSCRCSCSCSARGSS